MLRVPHWLIRHKPSTEIIRYAACSHKESRRGGNNHTANGRAGKSQIKKQLACREVGHQPAQESPFIAKRGVIAAFYLLSEGTGVFKQTHF